MIQRKRFSQNLFVILISLLLFTCQKDEVTPREYPRVTTQEVSDISSAGAIFHAEITYPGNGPITDHGFVWSTAQGGNLESADKKSLGPKPGKGTFTATVTHALEKGATYYVRAYAKGNEYLVYGKEVTFESRGSQAPEIHDFSPKTGTVGDTIVLRGAGFSFINYNNIVKLDTLPAYLIEAADTAVKAVIPQGLRAKSANVSITVTGNMTNAEEKFQLSSPELIEFTPKTGKAGDIITIQGKNLSHYPTENVVLFNGIIAQKSSDNKEELKVLVPSGLENPVKLSVSVAGQSASFADAFTYLKPQIKTFSPDSATYGDTLSLYGAHFTEASELTVKMGTEYHYTNAEIVEVNTEEIKVKVPLEKFGKEAHITVIVSGVESMYPNTLKYRPPEIEEITPIEFSFSDTLIIRGKNFHPTDDGNSVYFDEVGASIIKGSSEEIWVEVPARIEAPDGNITLKVQIYEFEIQKNVKLAPPVITDFYPKEVKNLTDRVTIKGKNFNPEAYRNYVYLGAENYKLDIVSILPDEIVVEVAGGVNDPLLTQDVTNYLFVKTGGQVVRADVPLKFEYKGRWTQKSDFPGPGREDATSVVIGDKAYLGLGREKDNSWTGYNDFWEYDPITDQWTQKADFPGKNRINAETFQIEGKGYIGLGYFFVSSSYDILSDFWEYDPVANTWAQKADFPGDARRQSIGFSLGNKGYVGGGRSEGYDLFRDFWEYDPQTDQWNQKNDIDAFDILEIDLDRFNYYTTSYTVQDQGYCLVGISSQRKQFKYNQKLDQWSLIGDYPLSGAYEPTSFVINDRVYFLEFGSGSQLDYYEVPTNIWRYDYYRGSYRFGGVGFSIGNKGYIGWGKDINKQLTDLWEYDPSR